MRDGAEEDLEEVAKRMLEVAREVEMVARKIRRGLEE